MAYKFQRGAARLSGSVVSLMTGSQALSGAGGIQSAGDLQLGGNNGYGMTSAGVASIASMGANWTNASRTVADLGTVSAATSITATDLVGTNIDGIIGADTARAGTFTALVATSGDFSDGNITNVGDLDCDTISVADGGQGLKIQFGGITATNKITLRDNLAEALTIEDAGNDYMKFTTTDSSELITFGQNSTFASTTIADLGTVSAATSITATDLVGTNIDGIIGADTARAGTFTAGTFTTVSASSTLQAAGAATLGSTLYVEDNLTVKSGSLIVGDYSLTNGGVATIASMGANWTNASRTVADMGTVTTMDLNGGNIDATVIGASTAAAGTFAAIVGTSLNCSEGNITNVGDIAVASISADDGSSFSMGTNWTNASRTVADMGTVTTIDLNGGAIDGTVIGANSEAAGTFALLSASSHLHVAGKGVFGQGVMIQGDLVVQGTSTVISSSQLLVKDALIGMGFSGSGDAISLGDRALIMGLAGENSVAMIWDESESEFAFVRTTTNPASGSGNVEIASYAKLRVDSIQGGQTLAVTAVASGTDLSTGFNYQTGSAAAAVTAKLPASPEAGDVVYVKANSGTDAGKPVTVSINGSHTIDGLSSVVLQSPDAAANFIYVTTNVWKIF